VLPAVELSFEPFDLALHVDLAFAELSGGASEPVRQTRLARALGLRFLLQLRVDQIVEVVPFTNESNESVG